MADKRPAAWRRLARQRHGVAAGAAQKFGLAEVCQNRREVGSGNHAVAAASPGSKGAAEEQVTGGQGGER